MPEPTDATLAGLVARTAAELAESAETLWWLCGKLDVLAEGLTLPGGSVLALVLRAALHRSRSTADAILVLARRSHPYGVETLPLARSLWELLLSVEYVCSAGQPHVREERAIRYLAYTLHSRAKVLAAMQEEPEVAGPVPAEAEGAGFVRDRLTELLTARGLSRPRAAACSAARLEGWTAEWRKRPYWSGKGPLQMARAIKRADARIKRGVEHAWVYPFLSQYAHAAGGSLLPLLHEPDGPVALAHGNTTARVAIQLVSKWLLQVYGEVSEVYGLGWERRLTDLYDAARAQWGRASA